MKTISRVSTVSILFACFLGLWSTRNHRYIVAAQQPSDVSITRIFTSSDGQTHAEEVHENLTAVAGRTGLEQSRSIRATGITFVRRAPGLTENWHTAPRRQYGITLSGRGELEIADGKTVRLEPGRIILIEDLTGKGHVTRTVGSEDWISILVPLSD